MLLTPTTLMYNNVFWHPFTFSPHNKKHECAQSQISRYRRMIVILSQAAHKVPARIEIKWKRIFSSITLPRRYCWEKALSLTRYRKQGKKNQAVNHVHRLVTLTKILIQVTNSMQPSPLQCFPFFDVYPVQGRQRDTTPAQRKIGV